MARCPLGLHPDGTCYCIVEGYEAKGSWGMGCGQEMTEAEKEFRRVLDVFLRIDKMLWQGRFPRSDLEYEVHCMKQHLDKTLELYVELQ